MKDSEKVDRNINAINIINNVLTTLNLTAPQFAKEIGINYQRIYDLVRGRTKKFNPGIVALIEKRFPQINPNYLYTGKGVVLLPKNNEKVDSENRINDISDFINLSQQLIKLFEVITEKNEQLSKRERELILWEQRLLQKEHEIETLQAKMNK